MLEEFINYIYFHLVSYGYYGITFMMTLESCFIPFPSEICMIPAGIEVANGNLNFYWAIFWGSVGSWLGASINYCIGFYWGRPFIEKYGRYMFLDIKKIDMMDTYFKKYGNLTCFIIRFVPVVRQLISIPAGMAKMNYLTFSIYSTFGAAIWVTVLVLIGQSFGNDFGAIFANQQINFSLLKEVLQPILTKFTIYGLTFVGLMLIIYIWFKRNYLKESN
jgi:membrane protein DedA with SNARE-associated domain